MFVNEGPEQDMQLVLAVERDKIVHALHGQICLGDDINPNKLVYSDCPGWEARKEILNIFDSVLKYTKQSIVIEKAITKFLIEKLGPDTFTKMMKMIIEDGYIEKEAEALKEIQLPS